MHADIDIEKVDSLESGYGIDLYVSSDNKDLVKRFVYGYLYMKDPQK